MAVGLAQACRYLDLPLLCVIDRKTSSQNARVLEAYGARIEMVDYTGLTSRDPAAVGAGVTPAHCGVMHIDHAGCVEGCRSLLRREAILAGGSLGGVIAAVQRLSESLPPRHDRRRHPVR